MAKKPVERVPADLTVADPIHIQCRDLKHAWTFATDIIPQREEGSRKITSITRVLQCIRCGTERHDEYSVPSFERLHSHYTYVEGYLLPGTHGHIPVSEVRAEMYRRWTKGLN
jgi:hypothetical protein